MNQRKQEDEYVQKMIKINKNEQGQEKAKHKKYDNQSKTLKAKQKHN